MNGHVVELPAGRELRLQPDGPRATVAIWAPVPGGQASLGDAEVDAQVLRRVIAALRDVLWELERAEAVRLASDRSPQAQIWMPPGVGPIDG